MKREHISRVFHEKLSAGSKVYLKGWVKHKRVLKDKIFIVLVDGSSEIQVVVPKSAKNAWNTMKETNVWSVIGVEGVVAYDPRAPGGIEVRVENMEVINSSAKILPIDPLRRDTEISKRFDYRFIDLRNPLRKQILVVASLVARYAREYFVENGFLEIFSPKIVAESTEGGANTFPVVYFGEEAYLAQSPQLYKQLMMLTTAERVFEIGPAFRAEPHRSPRHLCEFQSIDFEMAFIEDYDEVYKTAYDMLLYVFEKIKQKHSSHINEFFEDWEPHIPRGGPLVITFNEALRILRENNIATGDDELSTEAEKFLGEYARKEYGSDIIIVTEYPWSARPFYTMRKPGEPHLTKSFDILFRGLEIASGSQREHRYDVLVRQIREKGLDVERFKFYTEFFKYGMPPHGGAGLGLERITAKLLNLDNIKEARLLPRDPERLRP